MPNNALAGIGTGGTVCIDVTGTVDLAVDVTGYVPAGDVAANAPPRVDDQQFSIAENPANGAVVGTITGSDPEGSTLTYTKTGGNDAAVFNVAANGQISVATPAAVDFESTKTLTFTVSASDGADGVDTATITINVTDVDEAPQVDDEQFSIPENPANGAIVGSIGGSDPDGDTITYTVTGGSGASAFAVAGNGEITVADPSQVDFETNPSLTLVATATANGKQDTATITINVTDRDETPGTVSGRVFTDTSGDGGQQLSISQYVDADDGIENPIEIDTDASGRALRRRLRQRQRDRAGARRHRHRDHRSNRRRLRRPAGGPP